MLRKEGVLMRTNYFLITGMDEGVAIKPYMVETYNASPYLLENEYGDSVRYYEPLTKDEVIQLMKKGVELE